MALGALFRDLRQVYQHRPIQIATAVYGTIALVLLGAALSQLSLLSVLIVLGLAILLFPPVEYLLHRYVLHALVFLNTKFTARFWIRAHYAHHKHPSQTDVILADPATVAVLVAAIVIPASLVAPASAFAWAFAAVVLFLFYEIVHFSNHLPIEYENGYLRSRRQMHALHHYHNENKNFGICWTIIDRIVGTHIDGAGEAGRSPTVRNLGYDDALAAKKPIVRMEYEKRQASS